MTSIVPLEGQGVRENLSFEEVSVYILDRLVRRFSNKEIGSLKVLWRNESVKGGTEEAEADTVSHYPHLFPFILTLAWGI